MRVTRKTLAAIAARRGRVASVIALSAVFFFTVCTIPGQSQTQQSQSAFAQLVTAPAEEFPVTLIVNGESRMETTTGETVRELLRRNNITWEQHDLITPPLDQELKAFDEVVFLTREREVRTEEEEIPYRTHYYYSPEVRPGQEVVETKGVSGLKVSTYNQFLHKGILQEETLESNEILRKAQDEVVLVGFRSKPVSALDFEWSFDGDGEPQDCVNVIRSGRSAGYSAPAGAGTASGLPAAVGHVAVNPSQIPYGSKLFIQSPDGSFVYGYAVAADTGTALAQGKIDVDLFYATYAQSAANGIREVDIFVLE